MQNLDPTYLRYIYDNLIKGSVHPENDSELPDGLIGLYEEAFEEHQPVLQRQQLLQRFALFALLKKEVSAAFVAEVIGESETDTLEFINTFSSCFNSPEPGKFQLYHERLKVYVLSKCSEKEIQVIHEKLIALLELAIEEKLADEFEKYALEFLSEHLTVEAFKDETKGKKLLDFTKNETLWDRQIEISNAFKWSQEGLRNGINFGIKNQSETVIDCALGLVELYYREQNDAETIIKMVANYEIDLALERIEAYGGSTKEARQRQFILYMACLFQFTHGENKAQENSKTALESILKHFDEKVTLDCSELNWFDFYPSVLVFKIAFQLNLLQLDYSVIVNRTDECDFSFIEQIGDFDNDEYVFLLRFESHIKYGKNNRSIILESLAIDFAKKTEYNKALKIANSIKNKSIKSKALITIASVMNGVEERRIKLIDAAIRTTKSDKNSFAKSLSLVSIASKLNEQKVYKLRNSLIEESQIISTKITDENERVNALLSIAILYFRDDKKKICQSIFNQALDISKDIKDLDDKITALCKISYSYNSIAEFEKSKDLLGEVATICKSQASGYDKSFKLKVLAFEYARQKKFDMAFAIIAEIEDEYFVNEALSLLAPEIAKSKNFIKALEITNTITWEEHKAQAIKSIASEMAFCIKYNESIDTMLKSLKVHKGITDFNEKYSALEFIGNDLAKITDKSQAIKITEYIHDRERSGNVLSSIAYELALSYETERSFQMAHTIIVNEDIHLIVKLKTLTLFSKLRNSDKFKFQSLVNEALDFATKKCNNSTNVLEIIDSIKVFSTIAKISNEVDKEKILKTALEFANNIKTKKDRIECLTIIVPILSITQKNKILSKALNIIHGIKDPIEMVISICLIISSYRTFDKRTGNSLLTDMLEYIETIQDKEVKYEGLQIIAIELAKQGKFQKALKLTDDILSDIQKSAALNAIAIELSKVDKIELAHQVLLEINDNEEKIKCWNDLAYEFLTKRTINDAINKKNKFNSDDSFKYWIANIANVTNPVKANVTNTKNLLFHAKYDYTTVNDLLQMHALNCLFFQENYPQEKIDKFNKVLNIQWAIDIKNQLPN